MGAETAALELGILGGLRASVAGQPVELGPAKQQTALALLLCRANRPTSISLLVEAIWADDPPRTARKSVQVYVAGLRRLFGTAGAGDRIEHRVGGYVFAADATELDAVRFEQLLAAARGARHQPVAVMAGLLHDAVQLWRGPMLEALRGVPAIDREVERLTAKYLTGLESWAQAEVSLGNADAVLDRLLPERENHPLRERLAVLSMAALAQCGRRDDALAVYTELRQHLARELGLKPSGVAVALYQQLLTGVGAASAAASAAPGAAAAVLPADPPRFTGRRLEVASVGDLLTRQDSRLILITGPVGSGKTAIAAHLAHRLEYRFPDGRVFLKMREPDGTPRPVGAQLAALLRLSGCADPVDDDPQQAARQWRAWAGRRRMLLILDDAADHASVQVLLPEGGPTAVVVTSRSRLAGLDDCDRVPVPPLSCAEALELLGRLIGAARVEQERRSAERIVTALGLLPLAVHRAGVRLGYLRHLRLAEFAERLAGGSALAELDTEAGELHGRVSDALRDLAAPDRAALGRLGRLGATFTLDEAAAALGLGAAAARRRVESLIEASAVAVPDGELLAHEERYEVPVLSRAVLGGAGRADCPVDEGQRREA